MVQRHEIVEEIDYLRAKEAWGQKIVDKIDYLLYLFDWRAGVTRLSRVIPLLPGQRSYVIGYLKERMRDVIVQCCWRSVDCLR